MQRWQAHLWLGGASGRETAGGVLQVREDEPEARVGAEPHKTLAGGEIMSACGMRGRR